MLKLIKKDKGKYEQTETQKNFHLKRSVIFETNRKSTMPLQYG